MSNPSSFPPPGAGGPFPPGDPRNHPYGAPGAPAGDPRVRREQERLWQRAQRDQAKAWREYQREATRNQRRSAREQSRLATESMRAQARAVRRSTRAESFVGPLLLIGFAVVMLLVYSGRIQGPVLLAWFGRWWPLLLIVAGVVRLVEWAIARNSAPAGAPPVRFSLGGGTITLLILLSIVGIGAQGAIRASEHGVDIAAPFFDESGGHGWQRLFGAKHEQDAPAVTHTIAPDATLQIDNSRGDVTVTGTSDDGLLHIAQHKEVFANSDNGAESLLAELDPKFSGSDHNLTVRVAGPESSIAELTVLVPRTVHVVLNANRGDVVVSSLHAPVIVNGNHCDLNVSAIVGDVHLHVTGRHSSTQVHSVQGAVLLEGSGEEINLNDIDGEARVHGDFFGSGRLQHVVGRVNYDAGRVAFNAQRIDGEVSFDEHDELSATGLTGPVVINARSRNLNLSRIAGDVTVNNSSGHVDLVTVAPIGSITVDNRDGDVTLSMPANAHFTMSAETSDGSVNSDFPGASIQGGTSSRGSMSATVGGGGPVVHLTTTHGDIALSRNTEAPMAPAEPIPPISFTVPDVDAAIASSRVAVANAQKQAHDARAAAAKARADARRAVADATTHRD